MPIDRQLDRDDVVCIYPTEYYSVIKKKEILLFATMWTDLEGSMLSEISQAEKDKYCIISPNIFKRKSKLIKTISDLWLPEVGDGRGETG